MSQSAEVQAASTPRRHFKGSASRKIVIVVGGILLGGAVGFALEGVGLPAQVASTIGAVVTALCSAADELRDTRAEPRRSRVERLVQGDVFRHPALMAFYSLLAFFILVNLGLLPFLLGIGAFLYLTGLDQEYPLDVWEPYMYSAMYAPALLLVPVVALPIAKSAAHRVRRHAFLWIGGALTLGWIASEAALRLSDLDLPQPEEGGLSSSAAWLLDALGLAVTIIAVSVGCIWARKTQATFVVKKLFRQLSVPDQRDVIDLVKTLPAARLD
jgi:hypothetical protein